MNAALRNRIRAAIDQQARARRQPEDVCSGSGGDLENTTRGCKRCFDRKRHRERRHNDPAFRESENQRQRRKRARQATA